MVNVKWRVDWWTGGLVEWWDLCQMHNKNLSYAPLTLTDRRAEALQVGRRQATGDKLRQKRQQKR